MNEDAIRERAYLLWEADGGPHGRPDEYWYRAAAETATTEPAAPRPAKTAKLELKTPKRKDKPAEAKGKPAARPRAAVPKAAR